MIHGGRAAVRGLGTVMMVAAFAIAAVGIQPVAARAARATLVTPPVVTNVHAEPFDLGAEISFDIPPGSEGYSFTVHQVPDVGGTSSGATSPILFLGLTNGVSYQFTVTATDGVNVGDPSAASNAVVPNPAPLSGDLPTITAPLDGATVQAPVPITATSIDAAVIFSVDGQTLGRPVAVTGGSASTSWSSDVVANGPHLVQATNCFSLTPWSCGSGTAAVTVNVANAAPTLTTPTSGQTVSGSMVMGASSAVGSLAFFVDGVRVGFAAAGPFAAPVSVAALANGTHTAMAKVCNIDGTSCIGPETTVSFEVRNLLPIVTSISGSPFNPNGDGVRDFVSVHYTLPDPETAKWQVVNGAGTVVKGPIALGALGAGAHTFSWNGKDKNNTAVSAATFTILITTTAPWNGMTLQGRAARAVTVDRTAPQITGVQGGGTTWYSAGNPGALTSLKAVANLSERSTLILTVRTSKGGVLVGTASGVRAPGVAKISWNGKNRAGVAVPSGYYKWTLTAVDVAGNRRSTLAYPTHVIKLERRTYRVVLNGNQFSQALGTQPSCGYYSVGPSYGNGVHLVDQCSTLEHVQAVYRVAVPAANLYDGASIQANGASPTAPVQIYSATNDGGWIFVHPTVAGAAAAWYDLGPISTVHAIALGAFTFAVGVDNAMGSPAIFNINNVVVTLQYRVAV